MRGEQDHGPSLALFHLEPLQEDEHTMGWPGFSSKSGSTILPRVENRLDAGRSEGRRRLEAGRPVKRLSATAEGAGCGSAPGGNGRGPECGQICCFRRLRWQNWLAVGCPFSREGEETKRMQFGLDSYSGTATC